MQRFGAPKPAVALKRYSHHAAGYDASCERTQPLRFEAISRLQLSLGDCVLDAASGTGMSFGPLLKQIGEDGRLVAVELSPEMMVLAAQKVKQTGAKNVSLVTSTLEEADFGARQFDAVFCFYTHDVMRSEQALTHIFDRCKDGAKVCVAGMKLFPWYAAPLNLFTLAKAYPYMTTFEGLKKPWSRLIRHVPNLKVSVTQFGMGYIASGRFVRR